MPFVSEANIDEIVDQLEKGGDLEVQWNTFAQDNKNIAEFLFSESFEVLTVEERNYLLFLSLVICKACQEAVPPKNISLKKIEEAEEKNWVAWSAQAKGSFKEKLDPFFELTDQEDLLAFVEDALFYDEDQIITKVGREPMFIALKTLIDICCD
ncbi:MAG: hypothetical protein AAGK97_00260 [Bacteroidota bacterium]